ncbi:hypothetical protein [Streptomyces sp. NPDC002588]|uniref:hypothetical protein n=1 Tax=Streptomyces sp. NPDC002588 TaxID=3154419 RepID=UPI0033208067
MRLDPPTDVRKPRSGVLARPDAGRVGERGTHGDLSRAAIRVESTPTRFGRVSLDVRARENALDIRVLREGRGTGDLVPARLRLPGRFAHSRDIRVDGAPATAGEHAEVHLDLPDGTPLLVAVQG